MLKDRFTLQPGEPLAQVIPFKREDWEMELEVNENPNKNVYLHLNFSIYLHTQKYSIERKNLNENYSKPTTYI